MKKRLLMFVERCGECPFFDLPITKSFPLDGICTCNGMRPVEDRTVRPKWCPLETNTVMVIGGAHKNEI